MPKYAIYSKFCEKGKPKGKKFYSFDVTAKSGKQAEAIAQRKHNRYHGKGSAKVVGSKLKASKSRRTPSTRKKKSRNPYDIFGLF